MNFRRDFFWWWFAGSIIWVTGCIGVSVYAVVWGEWRLAVGMGFIEIAGKFIAAAIGPPFAVLAVGIVVVKLLSTFDRW